MEKFVQEIVKPPKRIPKVTINHFKPFYDKVRENYKIFEKYLQMNTEIKNNEIMDYSGLFHFFKNRNQRFINFFFFKIEFKISISFLKNWGSQL